MFKDLWMYIIIFVIVYLFYIIFVYKRKNVFKKFLDGKEFRYLKYKYKIKVNESNMKKIANLIFLANSFILSATLYATSFFENLALRILVGLATLIGLILLLYHIIGKKYGKER